MANSPRPVTILLRLGDAEGKVAVTSKCQSDTMRWLWKAEPLRHDTVWERFLFRVVWTGIGAVLAIAGIAACRAFYYHYSPAVPILVWKLVAIIVPGNSLMGYLIDNARLIRKGNASGRV